ncbi:MAG: acyl carrier protein [Alphaproteobacteria bacterium]|nr:acyl carrier protein [Alphaproteobacteria bacterium]
MHDRKVRRPRERLIEIVQRMLAKNAVARPVSIGDQLSAAGLSSMDMVNLMLAVETEFDIMIPPTDITPQNFHSIATIEALVLRLDRASPGSGAEAA